MKGLKINESLVVLSTLLIILCGAITPSYAQPQTQYDRTRSGAIETEGLQASAPVQADAQGRTLGLIGNALLGGVTGKPGGSLLGNVIGSLIGFRPMYGAGFGYGYPAFSPGIGNGFGYPGYSSLPPYSVPTYPGLGIPNYGIGGYPGGFGGYYG